MNFELFFFSMDIVVDDVVLEGMLDCLGNVIGLVIFVYGSGSLRYSLCN